MIHYENLLARAFLAERFMIIIVKTGFISDFKKTESGTISDLLLGTFCRT